MDWGLALTIAIGILLVPLILTILFGSLYLISIAVENSNEIAEGFIKVCMYVIAFFVGVFAAIFILFLIFKISLGIIIKYIPEPFAVEISGVITGVFFVFIFMCFYHRKILLEKFSNRQSK